MNTNISKLFEKVKSANEKISSNAITDLSFILEIRTWNLSIEERESRYASLLSRKVIESSIDESVDVKIVEFL